MEKWKDILGFEGYYQISDLGRVRSMDRVIVDKNNKKRKQKGRVLSPSSPRGYLNVILSKDCKYTGFLVHRLVAEAFIPNPKNKPFINHINNIRSDCRSVNLEWCTAKENTLHAIKNGYMKPTTMRGVGGRNVKCKSVIQYDAKMNFIRKFYSISEASLMTGCCASTISNVCNGKGIHAGGYRWRFEEIDFDFLK